MLLNLFDDLLDLILTDKILESESQEDKNENEKVESRKVENKKQENEKVESRKVESRKEENEEVERRKGENEDEDENKNMLLDEDVDDKLFKKYSQGKDFNSFINEFNHAINKEDKEKIAKELKEINSLANHYAQWEEDYSEYKNKLLAIINAVGYFVDKYSKQ